MADAKWTDAQRQVIDVRDKNVLVAAAAGSGKTAVLVEHIISLVTGADGGKPVDIDKLLVVTFTRAAAAEMRERVMQALQRKMKENPFDDHIRAQLTYIHNARITTIDSFCADVVRTYFNEIDIDPAFKIADNGDLELLKSDVMAALLEENYAAGSERFSRFIDIYSSTKHDANIEEEIWSLYRYAQSYPHPEKWLTSLKERYEEAAKDMAWLDAIMDMIKLEFSKAKSGVLRAVTMAESFGDEKLIDFIQAEADKIAAIELTDDFDSNADMISSISFGRFPTLKGLSEEDAIIKDRIKDERTAYKKAIETLAKKYFSRPYSDVVEDMSQCAPIVGELVRLVIDFGRAYKAAKVDKDMTDFADIEHYALDILAKEDDHGDYVPTAVAKEMSMDIHEIMIDEYQDSNLVQEIILNAVSGRGEDTSNIFMVGDVKQSIYKFRQARPELFLDKYDTYPATDDCDSIKIVLSKNFRSRKEVLDCCNMIFEQIMVRDLGGISYDDDNKLYHGMEFPEGTDDYKAEIMFIDSSELKELEEEYQYGDDSLDQDEVPAKIELEAAMTVTKIKELMYGTADKAPMQVYDKELKAMRGLRFGDIAILFRSTKGYAETYTEVFMSEGIPVHTTMSEGYFDVFEVSVILDMLSVIDNPRQDIKLAAVLRHVFGLTENMLADIRCGRDGTFYDAFTAYNGIYSQTVTEVKCQIDRYREVASYMSIYDLIIYMLDTTHFREFLMASQAGHKRMANVEMLLEKAKKYEEGAYSGLFNFVRYIELMKKYKVEEGEAHLTGENDDSVKIMTIHKSKGLEYPVVFVGGMGKRMNMMDVSKSIIVHPELGIGVNRVDVVKRLRYKTLVKEAIGSRIRLENLAEELRVLYVALTRAREKLILTGIGNVASKRDAYEWISQVKERPLEAGIVAGATTYMDWVMMAVARDYTSNYIQFTRVKPSQIMYRHIERQVLKDSREEALKNWDDSRIYDGDIRHQISTLLDYQYEHAEECNIRQKMSISDIKHMYMRMTASEELPSEEVHFGEPGEKGPSKGALRGTAYHRVLELFDYDKVVNTVEDIENMMSEMSDRGLIDRASIELVDPEKIYAFASSSLGLSMKEAYHRGRLYREKPFVMGIPACQIEPDKYHSSELVVVQGIVDAWYDTDDGIVVVDYKTDSVEHIEDLRARYESQLRYYGQALSSIVGKPIKELVIYSIKFNDVLVL